VRDDRPELGDRDLEVRQQLEQERLERVVGAVDLVDEQDDGSVLLERLEQRPAQQEAAREQGAFVDTALGRAQRQQLPLPVPVVERLVDVDALVALQPDQARPGRRGKRLGDLRLADPGLALEQQRLAEDGGQVDGDGELAVGEVALARERLADRLGTVEGDAQAAAARSSARRVRTRARCRL
jgi:hypothetical protein